MGRRSRRAHAHHPQGRWRLPAVARDQRRHRSRPRRRRRAGPCLARARPTARGRDRRRPFPAARADPGAVSGRVILTAAGMRAAEEAAIAAGTPVEALMERAGKAAAEAVWRYAGPWPALVLCGPGNNGGDGYVVAHELAACGVAVRVAALA